MRSSSGLMLTLVAVMCRCLPQGFWRMCGLTRWRRLPSRAQPCSIAP